MKKQEKSLGYIMFLWVIILIPFAISFIPLILPISDEELKYALTIILLIFVIIFCTMVISIDGRDKSKNTIYKLYIGTCRKFNRKTRQLTRVLLYIFMIYLFLGGICTAIDKNDDTAFFQLYIQIFPYIICLMLFIYLTILLFQKIIETNNAKKNKNLYLQTFTKIENEFIKANRYQKDFFKIIKNNINKMDNKIFKDISNTENSIYNVLADFSLRELYNTAETHIYPGVLTTYGKQIAGIYLSCIEYFEKNKIYTEEQLKNAKKNLTDRVFNY